MQAPPPIPPDTIDWTFVIERGCEQCGFTPHAVERTGERLRATIPAWRRALARPDATERPEPAVWSPVEYACHVRDVCRIFRERLALMLAHDDPEFAGWDQEAAAADGDYFHQDPARVADQLAAEVVATADAFDAVRADQWHRRGRRGHGAAFTVRTLAVYFLHDVEHHLHDVRR